MHYMHTSDFRLELFFKSSAQLNTQVIPWLHQHALTTRINLTNKAKQEPLLEYVATLLASNMDDICCHYSFKYQNPPRASPDACAAHLMAFLHRLAKHQSPQKCTTSCLLVSGGGKTRPAFDTVRALEYIATHNPTPRPSIHVAFNPYLPAGEARENEYRRLGAKLQTGVVEGVYLQMGSDVQSLEEGLKECRRLTKATQQGNGCLPVHGSVFVPSKRLLAQMRFRPWNGVFLSEGYLSSVDAAMRVTKKLLAVYAEYDVIPLVETAIRNEAELATLQELLGVYKEQCRRHGQA